MLFVLETELLLLQHLAVGARPVPRDAVDVGLLAARRGEHAVRGRRSPRAVRPFWGLLAGPCLHPQLPSQLRLVRGPL